MANDREHLATLAALLAMNAPHPNATAAARDAMALLRIGSSLHTLAVRECNGEGHWENGGWHWDDNDTARADRKRTNLAAKARKIADDYGCKVAVGGDPRGYVLRMHFPSHIRNGFADGWGIA